jgi:outer membrane protein W
MKHSIAILCIVALTTGMAVAQESTVKGTKAGDKALLFTLKGLSTLGAGDFGGGCGFRYHFTGNMAVRLGLGFGMNSSTEKAAAGTAGVDDKTTETSFSFAPALEYYIVHTSSVSGYLGVEAFFSMDSKTHEGIGHVDGVKTENSSSTVGAALLLGAEWFPWTGIGLGAEYHLHFMTSSGTSKATTNNVTVETDLPSETMIGLGSANSAAFTLSIYL